MKWTKKALTSIATTTTLLLLPVSPADAHKRKRNKVRVITHHHDNIWEDLAHCESTHRNVRGRYRGYFQFSFATWWGIGQQGDPADYSYEEQLNAAMQLQARSGWGQWPFCSRRLGLR